MIGGALPFSSPVTVRGDAITLDSGGLGRLLPMAVVVAASGDIRFAGPTLAKLRPGQPFAGRAFFDLFEIRRPRNIAGYDDLAAAAGQNLRLFFRDPPRTAFKGIAMPLSGGQGMVIDLSFGIGAVDALRVYNLSGADFSPTDLTVELLYVVEANAAVQDELRNLNGRLQGAKLAAEEEAFTDTLTGLRNRRALNAVLERYGKGDVDFALMHIDLDFFKEVNDHFGHAAGDHVLEKVARILVDETRQDDTVVRTGGDEFVVIFHRLIDRRRLAIIAARLLQKLERPIMYEGNACRISGSIGITLSKDYETLDTDRMLQDADTALYASKDAGRGRYCFTGDRAAKRPPD